MTQMLSSQDRCAALTQVVGDVDVALGLPNEAYLSADYFEEEKRKVFAASWAGIGFAKDLPEPLWVKPIEFLGEPLLLARDREGQVRVFYNVCRHRGMKLVFEAGKQNVIRCPYHSWSYDHGGTLKITPHAGGPGNNICSRLEKDVTGLIEIRSHVFMGVIFINLDGKAPAFEEANAGLLQRWHEYADKPLTHTGSDSGFTLSLDTNWKLAVENYCESYHLPWVHPSLNSYSRLEDHYHIMQAGEELRPGVTSEAFAGQGTLVYSPMLADDGRRFPAFDGLDPKWDKQAEYTALFPNVLLGVHKDHSFAIVIEPKGPTQSVEHVEIFYAQPHVAEAEWQAMRDKNATMWKQVFEEDIFVVEGMQKGRSASGFDGGVFAPAMDAPTHVFHQWAASKMLAEAQ